LDDKSRIAVFDPKKTYDFYCSFVNIAGMLVDIVNRSDSVDLTNYVVSGEFDLVRIEQQRFVVKYTCCPERYPDLTFFIYLRRKTLFYMYNIVRRLIYTYFQANK
jgi:hypothetical protein